MVPNKSLEGRRIRLVKCNDKHTKLPPGLEGRVSMVDSMGTVHVNWDNGSTLGLCYDDGDRWDVIPDMAAANAMMARYKSTN